MGVYKVAGAIQVLFIPTNCYTEEMKKKDRKIIHLISKFKNRPRIFLILSFIDNFLVQQEPIVMTRENLQNELTFSP